MRPAALVNPSLYARALDRRARAATPREGALRDRAVAQCRELGIPTTRQEEWRFTNLASLAGVVFETPSHGGGAPDREGAHGEGPRAVWQNATGELDLRQAHRLPPGVFLGREPADTLDAGPLARREHPLVALNTALCEGPLVLRVPPGVALEPVVQLVHRCQAEGDGAWAVHPRISIELGAGSRARVVEEHQGGARGLWLANPATEVRLGPGAVLEHVRVTEHGARVHHLGVLEVAMAKGSRYHGLALALGGALTRLDIAVHLGEPGAEATLDGLFLASHAEHVDHHTGLLHLAPHTTSRQLYRGVVGGQAQGVFNGKIVVSPGAQQVSAEQASHNLLLTAQARLHTKPELQIHADDVKCTHGATSGRLDEQALFYLRARGIPEAEARRMLIAAFATRVLGRLPTASLAEALEPRVLHALARLAAP